MKRIAKRIGHVIVSGACGLAMCVTIACVCGVEATGAIKDPVNDGVGSSLMRACLNEGEQRDWTLTFWVNEDRESISCCYKQGDTNICVECDYATQLPDGDWGYKNCVAWEEDAKHQLPTNSGLEGEEDENSEPKMSNDDLATSDPKKGTGDIKVKGDDPYKAIHYLLSQLREAREENIKLDTQLSEVQEENRKLDHRWRHRGGM